MDKHGIVDQSIYVNSFCSDSAESEPGAASLARKERVKEQLSRELESRTKIQITNDEFMSQLQAADKIDETKAEKTNKSKTRDKKKGDAEESIEQKILKLAEDESDFYRSVDNKRWAVYSDRDIIKTAEINSLQYHDFLTELCYANDKIIVGDYGIKKVTKLLRAKSIHAEIRDAYTRIGAAEDKIYLDLCDDNGQMVEIDNTGWWIVSKSPVLFRRSSTARALPEPVKGGSIDDLRTLVNVSDDDLIMLVGYLLGCLSPSIPYPLLIVGGEHGSAKSTLVRLIKTLIDPVSANIRSLSADEKDLIISAQAQHILAFDNVSKITADMSDALCRLATGGGIAGRVLYTDSDEVVMEARRPVILNGIRDIATRPDLVDRSILVRTLVIPPENRLTESDVSDKIDAARPKILGWLCDLVSRGLARMDETTLDTLPRMADFAKWVSACGDGAAWSAGEFISVYNDNRAVAVEGLAEEDTLVQLIKKLMIRTMRPQGSNTPGFKFYTKSKAEFLSDIKSEAGDAAKKLSFLSSSRALTGAIRESIPLLRSINIEIDLEYRTSSGRLTRIQMIEDEPPPF